MGIMLVTFRIMPESVETDLENIRNYAEKIAHGSGFAVLEFHQEPIAFGLKALIMRCSIDEREDIGNFEDKFKHIKGIMSVDVIDMRRGIG